MAGRRALGFVLLIGLLAGCSDAPKSPPGVESEQTSSATDKGAKKGDDGGKDSAEPTEQTPTNAGGPKLIAPSVNPGPAAEKPAPTHVISKAAEYYKSGPQQGRSPDGTFEVGAKVTLLESDGGYSRVRSEDGAESFVATESLEAIKAGETKK